MAETRIREALELLRERGWTRSMFEDEFGRLCSYGALAAAWTGNAKGAVERIEEAGDDELALTNVMNAELATGQRRYVTELNDMIGVEWPDIERCFEKAAVMREEAVDG